MASEVPQGLKARAPHHPVSPLLTSKGQRPGHLTTSQRASHQQAVASTGVRRARLEHVGPPHPTGPQTGDPEVRGMRGSWLQQLAQAPPPGSQGSRQTHRGLGNSITPKALSYPRHSSVGQKPRA